MSPRRLFDTPWASIACIAVAVLLSQAFYLGWMWAIAGAWGLPADDAWIHQTFARNLVHKSVDAVVFIC